MHAVDVAIHGRGAVASSLALALNQQGLRVAVSTPDPASAARTDVRAYALNNASRRLLQQLKVWEALAGDAVTAVHDMDVRGDSGGHLGFSSWSQCVDALAWIVDAPALDAALQQALQFAPHVQRLEGVLPDAPLRVFAEGKDSVSRASLPVRWERHAYGHTAIAARLTSLEPHANVAHQWFRAPDVLALLPFDQPAAGRSFALVWSLPQPEAERLMQLDGAGFESELNRAAAGGPPGLQLTSERFTWSLALASAMPVCGVGWVLVGDAAHVVHPLAGQGLNLGLGDVQALADTLRQREAWRALGDEHLLHRYARARAWPVWAMSHLTDALLHGFASDNHWLRELRNRGMGLVDRAAPVKRWLATRALEG
jgi:2-polyprenyl-6-methoxyphenol hydroxylase-like FAD-dependent oxidoreductase